MRPVILFFDDSVSMTDVLSVENILKSNFSGEIEICRILEGSEDTATADAMIVHLLGNNVPMILFLCNEQTDSIQKVISFSKSMKANLKRIMVLSISGSQFKNEEITHFYKSTLFDNIEAFLGAVRSLLLPST